MKDGAPQEVLRQTEPPTTAAPQEAEPSPSPDRTRWLLGAVACIVGGVGMIVWGLLLICSPAAYERMSASSVITIDGRGIFLILCVAAIVAGAALLLKSINKRRG